MPRRLEFGSDSEEEMDLKSEYIEELVKLQKFNGVLEFSQPDLPRLVFVIIPNQSKDIFKFGIKPCSVGSKHFQIPCY